MHNIQSVLQISKLLIM